MDKKAYRGATIPHIIRNMGQFRKHAIKKRKFNHVIISAGSNDILNGHNLSRVLLDAKRLDAMVKTKFQDATTSWVPIPVRVCHLKAA